MKSRFAKALSNLLDAVQATEEKRLGKPLPNYWTDFFPLNHDPRLIEKWKNDEAVPQPDEFRKIINWIRKLKVHGVVVPPEVLEEFNQVFDEVSWRVSPLSQKMHPRPGSYSLSDFYTSMRSSINVLPPRVQEKLILAVIGWSYHLSKNLPENARDVFVQAVDIGDPPKARGIIEVREMPKTAIGWTAEAPWYGVFHGIHDYDVRWCWGSSREDVITTLFAQLIKDGYSSDISTYKVKDMIGIPMPLMSEEMTKAWHEGRSFEKLGKESKKKKEEV